MKTNSVLLWLRKDLRLADNPALRAAVESGGAVVPVFIWSPDEEKPWAPGGASQWWLAHSLRALDESLRHKGSRLIVRQGSSREVLRELVQETGASVVFWNRRYEPAVIERDKQIKQDLIQRGCRVESFNGSLLWEPWEIQNGSGKPFQVYTPFWKACVRGREVPEPLPKPQQIPAPARWPRGDDIDSLGLEPSLAWADGFSDVWTPGEAGAQARLRAFTQNARAQKAPIENYEEGRNIPSQPGTSRLSPSLHFGELSPRQAWHAVMALEKSGASGAVTYLKELVWREFAYHLLYHFPQTDREPLRQNFRAFPWRKDRAALRAWQRGQTGYPIVDAGMRELWTTGWMHNRVRMIVASFLVKHLLVPWQEGAAWFWDTLVDADLASNTLGWQWTSGCGADAAPYFRVFNPVLQGEKFDPEGAYVKRWVPELASLPAKIVHRPWETESALLRARGIELGKTYPKPIVDHGMARDRALAAFATLKKDAKT